MANPSDSTQASPSREESTALQYRLMELITSSWVSQALHVTAELGLADRLAAGPLSSADLAEATSTDAPSLRRLLRALTTLDVCRELDDGRFEITELGALLGSNHPGSLNAWTRWWGGHLWPVFGNLLYSVKTGRSARNALPGTRAVEPLEQDRDTAVVFNQALAELTRLCAQGVLAAYDFSPFSRIVDVGGGYGELLASVLTRYPNAWGVLVDLPHAIEGAKRHLDAAGVLERCELVVGDFFSTVPGDGDAYLLKSVLHDWNDQNSQLILENCRRCMPEGARLLVVEEVLPDRLAPTTTHQSLARSDLLMLVAHAAQERTEGEFRGLLARSGFAVQRVYWAGPTFSIIEAIVET